tara:strand:+ start:297 stop:2579 length:2283 start_codon:yes stop_codon:yes gene_type:complete
VEFLDYIESLAPEGETVLFVRQKPQGGTYADGLPKCTWPAFMPGVKMRAGEAWYCNTASFIVDRFVDGKPSASAANCEYVLCMVLDDIGSKSKTPPLPPTWIMETSPGNYQWGYAFTENQPTKSDFSAAIIAIAAAGYTDAGAINAVRNFRLPGSVNLKPGKAGFASVLVEFHPERQYDLPEICAALGVVPGPATKAFAPIKLADDGNDDVLAWLSDNALVLSKANNEGWVGVICPNEAQHTDGSPGGRYKPSSRGYCCYHGHCTELDSNVFLDWVAANGGPKHSHGLRDELLVDTMASAVAKLKPSEVFPDVAAQIVEATEKRQIDRVEREGWYERFAYIQDGDMYFDLEGRSEIGRQTFNALFRHVSCYSVHPSKTKRRIEASVCYDENRQAKGALTLAGITYAAGEGVLVERMGQDYGNRWVNRRPATVPGDASPWLRHVERMIPDACEREHVLNVMAFKIQNPNRKINHAVLHIGHPGSGKDTMWQPFLWAIGGASLANVAIVRNEEITSQWGYALESEVMVFEELRQAEAKDRRALENHLKPIIAAPPEFLQVNRKGLHPYQALNRIFVLAFSNERVALSLPSDDRRFFVTYSEAPRMTETQGKAIWDWYAAGGVAVAAHWLANRDVSAFNPGAAPPFTEAKAIMVEHGRSTAESYLIEQLRARSGEFARGVIGSPFYTLCDRLAGQAPAGVKVPQAALMHALKEAGWLDMGRIKSRANDTKKHVYCAPDMADMSKSDLRQMVEDVPPPTMVRVK